MCVSVAMSTKVAAARRRREEPALGMPSSGSSITPSSGFRGRDDGHRHPVPRDPRLRARIDEIYAAACGKPVEDVHHDMERDRFFTAEQAREYGLIDRVLTSH